MSAEVDLHLHTLASDGRLTPTQLVQLTASQGLRTIAVSDHDTTDGLAEAMEAAKNFPGLRIIPGIELSADVPGDEVHVLGYFIDPDNAELQAELTRFREGRLGRAKAMVEKLDDLGIHVEWERVQHFAGDGAVGRPHIALALVEAGYCKEPKDAFPEYLGRNGLAYVERVKLTPAQAVGMIRSAGGLPSCSSCVYERHGGGNRQSRRRGLAGMEVHYAKYREDTIRQLARLAREYDLIPCGGSDYHGLGNSDECLPGENGPPMDSVERLEAAAWAARDKRAV